MAQPRDKFFIHPSSTPLKHFIQPRGQGRYTDAVFAEVTANGTSMTCSSSMRWWFQSKTELVTLRQQVLAGRLVTILWSIAAFWCVLSPNCHQNFGVSRLPPFSNRDLCARLKIRLIALWRIPELGIKSSRVRVSRLSKTRCFMYSNPNHPVRLAIAASPRQAPCKVAQGSGTRCRDPAPGLVGR